MASFILEIFFQFANTNLHLIQYRFYYFLKFTFRNLIQRLQLRLMQGPLLLLMLPRPGPSKKMRRLTPVGKKKSLKGKKKKKAQKLIMSTETYTSLEEKKQQLRQRKEAEAKEVRTMTI